MIPRSLPSSCGNTQCEWMRGRKCVCDGWLKDGHCEVRQIKKKSPCSRSWSAEFCSSAAGCFTSAIYRGGRNSAVLSFPASLKNTTMLRFIRNETTLAEKIREKIHGRLLSRCFSLLLLAHFLRWKEEPVHTIDLHTLR